MNICSILSFIIPTDADFDTEAVQSSVEPNDVDNVDNDRSAREVPDARFAPLASGRKIKRIKNFLVKSRYAKDYLRYKTNEI